MLQRETLVRQSSAPSSQQMSSENENSRSLLRPQSALGLSATSSLSVFEDADVSAPKALRSTVRKKQQTLDSLKALAPLTVNKQRVAFVTQGAGKKRARYCKREYASKLKNKQVSKSLNGQHSSQLGET